MTAHYDRCKQVIAAVEKVSQNEMEEIFKMIHSHGCTYTRNNNGLFINLAWISEELLIELENYIKFSKRSHTELKKYDSICHVLNNKINEDLKNSSKNTQIVLDISLMSPIDNDIEENVIENIEEEESTEDVIEEKNGSKISSSMKFSLLKKKYAKICTFQTNNIENDLQQERYIYDN